METKTRNGRHIVPENIARDLKNELGVDYGLSGARNAAHRIYYTCKARAPAFKHAIRKGRFGVATRHGKAAFTPKNKIDVWSNDIATIRHDMARQVRPADAEGTARIWHLHGGRIN